MERDEKIPLLLTYYFGEAAGRAQGGASRRLLKWSRAFEEWTGKQGRLYEADTVKQSRMAWRRLARQCQKMPWEIRKEDIEEHIEGMKEEGFAASTINCAVGIFESFYRWCDEREVDKACAKGFNPAREVKRLKVGRYAGASVWSDEEVKALMELVRRDETPIGRRDFAFFTARLKLGVPLKCLLGLEWGMLRLDDEGMWVRWRRDEAWMRLPAAAWEAMDAYLRASGRSESMAAGKFIFAPLAFPGRGDTGSKAEDWLEEKPLSNAAILESLKIYGRRVGIEEGKLNFMALRRTAMRMKLDEGASVEDMQVWLDSREEPRFAKYRLKYLPGREGISVEEPLRERPPSQPPPNSTERNSGEEKDDQSQGGRSNDLEAGSTLTLLTSGRAPDAGSPLKGEGKNSEVPVRKAKPFREGEGITHGMYRRRVDREQVRAVMRENIVGVDEEIRCMEELMAGMLEVDEDWERMMEAYSQAMGRMQVLVQHKESPKNREAAEWVKSTRETLVNAGVEMGLIPESERERVKEVRLEGTDTSREMVATMRLMLRNIYKRAREDVDPREYLRLVDLYGAGCVRLSRVLRAGGDEYVRIRQMMWDEMDRVLKEVGIEMGIGNV